jgi:tungstate transport system ATP-binding protein
VQHGQALAGHGRHERRERAQACSPARLADLADRQALNLSGGEQQVLALARAAVLEPRSSSSTAAAALDPAATARIELLLQLIARDGVYVSHGHPRPTARPPLRRRNRLPARGRLIEHRPAAAFFSTHAPPSPRLRPGLTHTGEVHKHRRSLALVALAAAWAVALRAWHRSAHHRALDHLD